MDNKKLIIIYFIIALLAFSTSVCWFLSGNNTGLGVMWLIIGSINVFLGIRLCVRKQDDEKEEK